MNHEEVPKTYTVIERNDDTFEMVPDSEVDQRLEALNTGLEGQQKSAKVYSKSGLTKEQALETLESVEKK